MIKIIQKKINQLETCYCYSSSTTCVNLYGESGDIEDVPLEITWQDTHPNCMDECVIMTKNETHDHDDGYYEGEVGQWYAMTNPYYGFTGCSVYYNYEEPIRYYDGTCGEFLNIDFVGDFRTQEGDDCESDDGTDCGDYIASMGGIYYSAICQDCTSEIDANGDFGDHYEDWEFETGKYDTIWIDGNYLHFYYEGGYGGGDYNIHMNSDNEYNSAIYDSDSTQDYDRYPGRIAFNSNYESDSSVDFLHVSTSFPYNTFGGTYGVYSCPDPNTVLQEYGLEESEDATPGTLDLKGYFVDFLDLSMTLPSFNEYNRAWWDAYYVDNPMITDGGVGSKLRWYKVHEIGPLVNNDIDYDNGNYDSFDITSYARNKTTLEEEEPDKDLLEITGLYSDYDQLYVYVDVNGVICKKHEEIIIKSGNGDGTSGPYFLTDFGAPAEHIFDTGSLIVRLNGITLIKEIDYYELIYEDNNSFEFNSLAPSLLDTIEIEYIYSTPGDIIEQTFDFFDLDKFIYEEGDFINIKARGGWIQTGGMGDRYRDVCVLAKIINMDKDLGTIKVQFYDQFTFDEYYGYSCSFNTYYNKWWINYDSGSYGIKCSKLFASEYSNSEIIFETHTYLEDYVTTPPLIRESDDVLIIVRNTNDGSKKYYKRYITTRTGPEYQRVPYYTYHNNFKGDGRSSTFKFTYTLNDDIILGENEEFSSMEVISKSVCCWHAFNIHDHNIFTDVDDNDHGENDEYFLYINYYYEDDSGHSYKYADPKSQRELINGDGYPNGIF